MIDLTNLPTLIPLLKKHGLYSQKHFGQHFLTNRASLMSVVEGAEVNSDDVVIEIGPGTGVLTRELGQRAGRVLSFEIDRHFEPMLEEVLADMETVEVVYGDFLKVRLDDYIEPDQRYKVVANLPYNVGSKIVDMFISHTTQPEAISVLLQKEVAEKMTGLAPEGTYLGNFVKAYGDAEIIRRVPAGHFFPAPRVESAVLVVEKAANSAIQARAMRDFSGFLHRGFSQPRKKLNKAFAGNLLEQAGISADDRPQHVDFESWVRLFELTLGSK